MINNILINRTNILIPNFIYYFNFIFLITSGISISVSQAALGISIVLCIYAFCIKHKEIKFFKSGLEKYFLTFFVISTILSFISPSTIENILYIKDFWLVSSFIIITTLIKSKDDFYKVFKVIIFIVLFQTLFALIQYSINFNFMRILKYGIGHYKAFCFGWLGSFLGNHLTFSGYLMMFAIPLLYLSFLRKKYISLKLLWLIRISAMLLILCILFSKTRSIIIALPFAVVPLLINKIKIFLLCFSLIITIVFLNFGFFESTKSIKQNFRDNIYNSRTAHDRYLIWKNSFRVWKKHPFIGTGGSNFLNEFKKVIQEHPDDNPNMITHAHNDYLNQLARKGIIGFLAFLYMLYGFFKYMVLNIKYINDKVLRYLYLGLFGSYCTFLVASMFQCFYTDEENLVMLWFTIGLLVSIVKVEKGISSIGQNRSL